ncbi:mitochondrial potassium channel ATP-binding subunit-like isoform X2 [Cetorhinus maximus]
MLHLCLRSGVKARGFFPIRSVYARSRTGGTVSEDSGRLCLSWGQRCWRHPIGMKASECSFFFQLLNESGNCIRQRVCGWLQGPVRTRSAFLLVATPGLITLGLRLHSNKAHCEESHRCKVQKPKKATPKFNWKEFWKFLRPELTALIWAVIGLKSAAQTIGCLVSLYFVSPKLTNLMCLVMPVLIGTGAYLGSYLRELSQKAQEQIAKATCVADEALGNIRTVKAFAMEDLEIQFFSREVDKSSNMSQILGLGIGIFQGLSNFTLNCIVLGTICVSGLLLAKEQLRAGDMMSFLVATQTVQRSLANISTTFGQVIRGMSSGSRVFEFMTLEPVIPVKGGLQIPLQALAGLVQFNNITFSYPTRPGHIVLHNFNLTLPASKMVAIVGQSGTGKSTVASLLERFYDPDGGVITLDGYNIRTLDPHWLRSHIIGYISQEPVLFGTTIKENIRFGKPDASDEEIYEAARQANADGFIQSFPNGYMTIVGERGIALSGGQKQRIAIARALIKNPCILVLDEATSALDAESERVVQDALDHIQKGRTVLVIAHRLSTIKAADVICVLANGHVKEVGTHAELLKRGGLYAELVRRQTSEEPTM